MTGRIFRSIFLVALAVFTASVALILGVLYDYFHKEERQQLRNQTALTAQGVELEGFSYLEGLELSNCRITWVARNGTVLYDNQADPAQMENHLQREEIREALETGFGESTRYSDTLTEQGLYCAVRLSDGGVIRLASMQGTVVFLMSGMVTPLLAIFLFAVLLSLLLAFRLAKGIVKPLNALNLEKPLEGKGYAEIAPLLRRIHSQQKQLKAQQKDLERQQGEFQAVTGSMSEGLVLLNARGIILSINPAAKMLLGAQGDPVGKSILSLNHSLELQMLLSNAAQGQRAEKTAALSAGQYQLDMSPVASGGIVSGMVLLIFDVTEKEKAETIRREFTANVSHELKTPLHSISGYAELLSRGLVKQEDIPGFSEKIYTEAQRMIRLVEDIIRLSQLDEGADNMPWELTCLGELSRDVICHLQEKAAAAGITLHWEGTDCQIWGIRQLLYTLLMNLCDNSIKYSTPGGAVTIVTEDSPGEATVSVRDTGLGIPPEHHSRVFERFYRVDKSHSKAVGGTGLGLSIVKRIAAIHHTKPELESAPGAGTTITIRFSKEKRPHSSEQP